MTVLRRPATGTAVLGFVGPVPTEAWSAAAGSGGASNDDSLVVAGVLGLVVCCVGLLVLLWQARRSESAIGASPDRGGGSAAWPNEVRQVCAEGRSLVELTAETTPDEPGSGLSLHQLGEVASRLELLTAHVTEAERCAPSPTVAHRLRVASAHADNLCSLVETERRIRLTSAHPSTALLDATALQLNKARISLDDALRDVSRSLADWE